MGIRFANATMLCKMAPVNTPGHRQRAVGWQLLAAVGLAARKGSSRTPARRWSQCPVQDQRIGMSAVPLQDPSDRPRAKALGRHWRRPFGTFPCWGDKKKESGFGFLVSRGSRQRNSRCRPNRKKNHIKTLTRWRHVTEHRRGSGLTASWFQRGCAAASR